MATSTTNNKTSGVDQITPVQAQQPVQHAGREKAAEFLANHEDLSFTYEEEQAVLRRIDMRVLPLLLGAYFFQQLDKSSLRCVPFTFNHPFPQSNVLSNQQIGIPSRGPTGLTIVMPQLRLHLRHHRRRPPGRQAILLARLDPLPQPAGDAAGGSLRPRQAPQRQGHRRRHPPLGLLAGHHVGVHGLRLPARHAPRPRLLRGRHRALVRGRHADVVAARRADAADELLERHERRHEHRGEPAHLRAGAHTGRPGVQVPDHLRLLRAVDGGLLRARGALDAGLTDGGQVSEREGAGHCD